MRNLKKTLVYLYLGVCLGANSTTVVTGMYVTVNNCTANVQSAPTCSPDGKRRHYTGCFKPKIPQIAPGANIVGNTTRIPFWLT